MGIRRLCICGGLGGRWRRRGRCCGLRWWMIRRLILIGFPTEEDQAAERRRLFGILERLVVWKNSNDPRGAGRRREPEIEASCDGELPNVLDPFCGGGTIPLEAQRLGLPAYGGDLNPVAVLISKALVEIPPRFAGLPPVNPDARPTRFWEYGVHGSGRRVLAEDIGYYGRWMRDRAFERIGHLYPKVTTARRRGREVRHRSSPGSGRGPCSLPILRGTGHVPLVRSWVLRKAKTRTSRRCGWNRWTSILQTDQLPHT